MFFSQEILIFFFFFEDIRKGRQILCLFYERKMSEGRRPFYRRKNGKEKKNKKLTESLMFLSFTTRNII